MPSKSIQVDLMGDGQYSHNNFTDVKIPYDGVDSFAVLKLSYWLDEDRNVGPYVELIPSYASVDQFFWQRNVQGDAGLQWYVFGKKYAWDDPWRFVRAVRLFAQWSGRWYYDVDKDTDLTKNDVQAGFDYYFDNLVGDDPMLAFVYQSLTFRKTNFTMNDYNAVLWSGNIKCGPRVGIGETTLVPYAMVDYTYEPRYADKWYENFLRIGGGLRWYPHAKKPDDSETFLSNLAVRCYLFVEVLHNASWLGDAPPPSVREDDFRVGFAFSTDGFVRDDFMSSGK